MPANTTLSPQQTLIFRLAVGLVFGLAIAWLTDRPFSGRLGTGWPEIWHLVATTTLTLGAFVLWAGAGAMRRISYVMWGVIALLLIAGISWHRAINDGLWHYNPFFGESGFLLYPFLFITHELVSSGDQARKIVAPMPPISTKPGSGACNWRWPSCSPPCSGRSCG